MADRHNSVRVCVTLLIMLVTDVSHTNYGMTIYN